MTTGGRLGRAGRLLAAGVGLALALGVTAPAWSRTPAEVDDREVAQVAAELRCVVCQNLSVADSPSEMARQMRDLIRERLAAGQTPDEVKAYFVERYGQWVLLAPPVRGLNVLLWLAPFVAVAVGLGIVLALGRRARRQPGAGPPVLPLETQDRARIAAELERLRE